MSDKKTEQPMTPEELHDATLSLLKKLIEVCDAAGVQYMLAYGTLLGAVRHQGFIPWDDDCDIMMLRPEYERFAAYCKQHARELLPYKFITRQQMPPTYLMTIGRFIDTRYRMETNFRHDTGIDLFLDIHPIDGAGRTREEAMEVLGERRRTILEKLHRVTLPQFPEKKGLARAGSFLAWGFWTVVFMAGYGKKLLDQLDALGREFPLEESDYVGSLIWVSDYHSYKKSSLEQVKQMPFEGMSVNVPVDPDDFLTAQYGDYMKLPPVEQRLAKHNYRLYRRN